MEQFQGVPGASQASFDTLNTQIIPLEDKAKSIIRNTSDFNSWTFVAPKTTGCGIIMGFAEVWAFSWASSQISASQIVRGLRNQGDRGFTFAIAADSKTITITTTSTVWGGATVIV